MHFLFYESLLPVIMGRGVEITTKNVMLVFWAQNSSFFFWIYPALLSQRPTITAPTIWMDWRATSWHPHRHSQPISLPLTSGPVLSLENVLPLGLKQPKTPFPYHNPPSELSIWPALVFIHPVLSASISQEFLNILNPAVSPLLIFLWILFCF